MSATLAGWHAPAHQAWQAQQRQQALDLLLVAINQHGPVKPLAMVLQLAYYLFLLGDPAAAAHFLELQRPHAPQDPQLLLNLAVCLSRSGQDAQAVERARDYLAIRPDDPVVHDVLCKCLRELGRDDEARAAGTRALMLKDAAARPAPAGWRVPPAGAAAWLQRAGLRYAGQERRDVVAFSLWGSGARYLRGMVHNLVELPKVYPGWQARIYLDDSVPAATRALLAELGADLRMQPPGQPTRRKLCWRFEVADDPTVGRFLVRDVDSVVNLREQRAVQAWIASDRAFHVMRDWWTHTDLMLAGMWGGIAGALPDMAAMLDGYEPAALETPNVDQWFLRDVVWGCVRHDVLVHDRCFTLPGTRPWPDDLSAEVPPPVGNWHVGQDEHAARRAAQAVRIAPWLGRIEAVAA
ncbi:tetratricopeptide repeat protein [Leptothrix sp. BB-4]